jgi:hypothetical protein
LPSACQPTSAFGRNDARWRATIHDISVSGVSLVVPRRFEPGAGLAVELPGTDGKDAYLVLAKVMRATLLNGGSWLLGCNFISELSDDEVERLFPPAADEAASSESQTPAVPEPVAPSQVAETAPAPLSHDGTAKKALIDVHFYLETRPGVVLNCLIKQLDIPETWPLTPGQVLTMWGRAGNGPLPLFKIRVVRCGQRAERWIVHGRILELITADQMHALSHLIARK